METFGTLPSGETVHRIRLKGGGLTAHVLTYGAVLQDLRLDQHAAPLVLGFPEFAPYLTHSPYFGATVGRCANRIRDGHVVLDDETFQLDRNFIGKHMLHGGADGLAKQLWQVAEHGPDHATLTTALEDGHMGFPGRLDVQVRFAVTDGGTFDIRMTATTDAPTLCNLAHHSYFNLDGGATISDHLLRVAADRYLPVDQDLIPTGEIRALDGTAFDFRTPAPVGQAHPVDHNFCLSETRRPMRPVAWLASPSSGIAMECRTTEPGLQIYDGAHIDIDLPGLTGTPMAACAGLALEPQVWPDANHHSQFPQAVLRPGERYDQHTQFCFSRGAA